MFGRDEEDEVVEEKKEKELSSAQQSRRLLVNLVFKAVMLFMGAVALIFGVYSLVSGSSLFIPKTADGIIESVEVPNSYAWNVQIIRKVRLPGQDPSVPPIEQHSMKGAVVDQDANKFQAKVAGVFPLEAIYNSDGVATTRLFNGDTTWAYVTDVCSDKPAAPVTSVLMPDPEMLKAADPKLESDEATFFGKRAWLLDITPTQEMIEQMFWLDFFDTVNVNPALNDYVLSKEQRELIKAGDYTVTDGTVLIAYDKPRYIGQIDMRMKVGESEYRIMAQYVPLNETDPIADKAPVEPEC